MLLLLLSASLVAASSISDTMSLTMLLPALAASVSLLFSLWGWLSLSISLLLLLLSLPLISLVVDDLAELIMTAAAGPALGRVAAGGLSAAISVAVDGAMMRTRVTPTTAATFLPPLPGLVGRAPAAVVVEPLALAVVVGVDDGRRAAAGGAALVDSLSVELMDGLLSLDALVAGSLLMSSFASAGAAARRLARRASRRASLSLRFSSSAAAFRFLRCAMAKRSASMRSPLRGLFEAV